MTQVTSKSGDWHNVQLRNIAAFAQISKESENKLYSHLNLQRFQVGQNIIESTVIPANAYLIVQGDCRLIGFEKGRLVSFERFGPGSFVGLASLLRSSPCEAVTAATEVIAGAIPDEIIVELYLKELSFRNWCNSKIWTAELICLYGMIHYKSSTNDRSLRSKLPQLLANSEIVTQNTLKDPTSLKEILGSREMFVASANTSEKIGVKINSEFSLPKPNPPFDLRLICFPVEIDSHNSETKLFDIEVDDAPTVPQRSGMDLGQFNPLASFKLIRGSGPLEETLACFQMLSAIMKLPFRRDSIDKILRDSIRRGQDPSLQLCGQLCSSLGLHVVYSLVPAAQFSRLLTPSLLKWNGGFVLAIANNANGLLIASPKEGQLNLDSSQIYESFPEGIEVLQVNKMGSTPDIRFGLGWFLPALKRYRGVLIQVFVASFVVQLFTLANPLLIQVIIDKVISQRSLDTLQILGFALLIVTLLEGVLNSLKTFLFVETTNRIDQRLGSEVIDHLLRLPLGYFDRRPVGELGTRVAELEKIRNFLTGQALTTILDAIFAIIYIVVMIMYSWILTLSALAVLPIQIGITLLGAPLFRRQFRQAAEENAKTQSHLVEVLTGIQTVKAQNVEMISRWNWQTLYSRYISRTYEQTVTATAVNQSSQVLQKISQLLVLWFGASMVLAGNLTLGQLIAFRIISGYVTQPLLRLSSIWQNVQELRVSFERLADVIDTPLESDANDQANVPLPSIIGKVNFNNVDFSFAKQDNSGQDYVLKNITLEVEPGTFLGIVGQSGSGKSTLMKLLPRLYSPISGNITIDEYDIDKVELYSLRRQIGIVPQDPLLFSGTVSENIALTNPEADSDDIVHAAKLACAHDFIMTLPSGYSTSVGERGGALSGGQRQRIAIARTLLSRPKLLVMDEATSSLDYETERALCNNLLDNLKHCTVFFITHRLSTIRRADRIVMMHQGTIVESGTHESLMDEKGRYYALYRQQDSV